MSHGHQDPQLQLRTRLAVLRCPALEKVGTIDRRTDTSRRVAIEHERGTTLAQEGSPPQCAQRAETCFGNNNNEFTRVRQSVGLGVWTLHGEVSAGMLQRSGSLWLGSLGLIEDAVHLCNLLLVLDFGLKTETAR